MRLSRIVKLHYNCNYEFLRPDKEKIWAIVKALDVSHDGAVSLEEVKVLFSKLLGVTVDDIPDDHEEVVAFAGLEVDV